MELISTNRSMAENQERGRHGKEKRMWKAWMEELHGKRKSLFGFEGTAHTRQKVPYGTFFCVCFVVQ